MDAPGTWICPDCNWANSDLTDHCPNPDCSWKNFLYDYREGNDYREDNNYRLSTKKTVQEHQSTSKYSHGKHGSDDNFGREAQDRHQSQAQQGDGISTPPKKNLTESSLIPDATNEIIKTSLLDPIEYLFQRIGAIGEQARETSSTGPSFKDKPMPIPTPIPLTMSLPMPPQMPLTTPIHGDSNINPNVITSTDRTTDQDGVAGRTQNDLNADVTYSNINQVVPNSSMQSSMVPSSQYSTHPTQLDMITAVPITRVVGNQIFPTDTISRTSEHIGQPRVPSRDAKVNYLVCDHATCEGISFHTLGAWRAHMDRHNQPYRCNETGCQFTRGFGSKGELSRHMKAMHMVVHLKCPEPGCSFNCQRKDNLQDHINRIHKNHTPWESVPFQGARIPPARNQSLTDPDFSRMASTVSQTDTPKLNMPKSWPTNVSDDDNESIISYTNSIFSVESLASSSTGLSEHSGYSSHQIITATRELMLIFHQDETLIPLYRSAIRNGTIGAERFRRNLGRLFKAYGKNLEEEAKDRLEYLAARLVVVKAKALAESIIEKFGDNSVARKANNQEVQDESSEEDSRPVNEDVFEDLVFFRNFLVRSEAFHTLRSQIYQFVIPGVLSEEDLQSPKQVFNKNYVDLPDNCEGLKTDTQPVLGDDCVPQLRNRNNWRQQIKQYWALFALAIGQIDPVLEPGRQRLRWRCKCGMHFFGDITELRPGGIKDLKTRMEQSSGAKFEREDSVESNTRRRNTYQRPLSWLWDGLCKLGDGIRKASNPPTASVLPQTNPCTRSSGQTVLSKTLQQQTLHMMVCMHKGKHGKRLYQDRIEDVTTDRQLFEFLKDQYISHKGKMKTALTLHSIRGISFVKFRLPIGGSAEVRLHDFCCRFPSCECLPPEKNVEPAPQAEYRCRPVPPETSPPIMPEYLLHLFITPSCINECDTWILDQLPKRVCGELHGKVGQPAEGWGIYYQEGWDLSKITAIVITFFLFGSLLFGTMWAFFKKDLQGAFGVSAWIVSVGVALASLTAMGIGRL